MASACIPATRREQRGARRAIRVADASEPSVTRGAIGPDRVTAALAKLEEAFR
jgi:hypothetical protein